MAKIKSEGPGSIILEVISDVIQIDVCMVATALLISGYSLE
jgi:hypothetical protein